MAEIKALSDTLKSGNELEKTKTVKGKNVADPESAASLFAAMLSGSMYVNSNADPKGQIVSVAGQESEGKQNFGNPVQGVQKSNGQGNMPGYGNLFLSFVTKPMLESHLSVGKEANSEVVMGQGNENSSTANLSSGDPSVISGKDPRLAILDSVFLASGGVAAQSGMTMPTPTPMPTPMMTPTPQPQGDVPVMAELDEYRQVIADLLNSLSGEITNTSLKGTSSSSESTGTQDISHVIANILQGWTTGEIPEALQVESATQTGSSSVLNSLKEFAGESVVPFAEGNSISSEIIGEKESSQDIRKILQSWMSLKETVKNTMDKPLEGQEVNEAESPQRVKGNVIEPAVTAAKSTDVPLNSQQRSTEGGFQESSTTPKNVQSQFSGPSTEGDLQNPNSNLGVGVTSNILAPNVADGKTMVLPVWKQIASVFQEQVINRRQALKELDIQLHPADLGKIQIAMRWENGQLHLQLQATEAGTAQLLQNQLLDLRHTLTSQGVNCGMMQMGQGGEQQNHSRGDESQRTFKQSSDLNEDEDLSPVTTNLSIRDDEINRVNVTA